MTPSRASPRTHLWSSSAQNEWMPLVLVILLGHNAVMNLLLGTYPHATHYLNAGQLVIVALGQFFAQVKVRLDTDALAIHYGYFGWPRQRIAIGRISEAQAFVLDPSQHGGWGYRGCLRFIGRADIVVRAGPALRLVLDAGKHMSITVDDAEAGARAINASRTGRRPS